MNSPTPDLDRLVALAEAATPGPWAYPGIESVSGGLLYGHDQAIASIRWDNDDTQPVRRPIYWQEADANGAFIAACDPATITALVERIRKLEAELTFSEQTTTNVMAALAEPCVMCANREDDADD